MDTTPPRSPAISPHTFTVSRTINAPAAVVWKAMSDVQRWHEWTPTITAITPLADPALIPGARFKVKQPKLPATIYKVTELNPGFSFAWEARSPGLRTIADHRITPQNEGQRVDLVFTYTGPMAFIARRVFARLTHDFLTTEIENLKRLCERGGN